MKREKVLAMLGAVAVLCVSLIIWINYSISAHAATYVPQSTIITRGPEGIKASDYFDYKASDTFTGNSAQLVNSANYPDSTDIVEMNDGGNNEDSAIWGKQDTNYFDVSKPQKLSVWMYLGDADEAIDAAGEGIAFVLQNSGSNAISRDVAGNPAPGQTLGVWGDDNLPDAPYATAIKYPKNTSADVAKTAIQNSWALEFDTNVNTTKGAYANSNSKLINDPYGQDYDGTPGTTSNLQVRQQHIAWNYPALDTTYANQRTAFSNILTSGIFLQTNKTFYSHQLDHVPDPDNTDPDNDGDLLYGPKNDVIMTDYLKTTTASWHHLTIDYTPPTDGDYQNGTGLIKYFYCDKNYDGTANTSLAKGYRYGNSDVKLSNFNLSAGNTKLYYGFTGSTGTNGGYDAVIFETMPSMVEADADETVTDTTQGNKTITDGSNVASGDDLHFDYNLKYVGGKVPLKNIKFESVPVKDLTYGDEHGNLGEIKYKDGTIEEISPSDMASYIPDPDNSTVTAQEIMKAVNAELSAGGDAVSVTLYAKANKVATDTKEDAERSTFIGDLYKKDLSSPTFTINSSKPHIEPTGGTDKQTVQKGSEFQLLGNVTEVNSDNKPQDFKAGDMKVSTNINGKGWTDPVALAEGDTSTVDSYTLKSSMGSSGLKDGLNIVSIRVTDANGNFSDADYHITVNDIALNIKADKPIIDVNNDDPVNITGTFSHIDGSALESGTAQVYVKVGYEDGTMSGEREYDDSDNASGKFSVNLKPFGYDMNSDATSKSESYDDFIKDMSYTWGLLKEGTNTVYIRVDDAGKHKSDSTTVVVNVPKITPKLTIDSPSQTSVNTNFNIPVKADLGSGYSFNANNLKYSVTANNVTKNLLATAPTSNQVGPVNSPFSSTVDAFNFDKNVLYPMTVTATDVYGRKSAPLDVSFTYVENILKLNVGDYSFRTVNLNEINNGLVHRKGDWNINVDSYKTNWDLSATGSDMYKQLGDGSTQKLNGNMVYVDKNNQSHLLDDQLIDQDDTGSDTEKNTNVSDDWTSNEGILLDLYSSDVSGTYTGTINWTLVQAP
ncbi:hypothetical protein [Companilactobacillus hulinensis]|uniref:hypothetical protein n=1 Tax=Companilactobacillus hulinensis TaxID=2486007 RepID=UPI000F769CCF|nr:hypothetical protein [Companilactobacillus hulinensis]